MDSDCGGDSDYDADADGHDSDDHSGDDCDDADAAISPSATETWYDGVDSDCGGDSDYDADADGHDSDDHSGDDCDDAESAVSPSATEVCDNGIDDDCDGGAGTCRVTGSLTIPTDADVVLYGAGISSGPYYKGSGDHNGDGYTDIAIGDQGPDDVYILEGPTTGRVDGRTSADVIIDGSGNFGVSLAWAGDMDNDGYDELLVGADLHASQSGSVFVAHGPLTSGTYTDHVAVSNTAYRGRMGVYPQTSGAGDVNGDGYDDMIIGQSFDSRRHGYAYLFLGPVTADVLVSAADTTFSGANGTYGATNTAGAGDLDGDGYDDLIIGSAYASEGGGSAAGAAYIIFGPASADIALTDADVVLAGQTNNSLSSWVTSPAGDTDGDGNIDIVMGSSDDTAWLFNGPFTTDRTTAGADVEFTADVADSWLGYMVSDAGDLDQDGFDDVVIGAWDYDDDGAAFVWYGPISGAQVSTDAELALNAVSTGYGVGFSVQSVGDYNADGFPDLGVFSRSIEGSSTSGGMQVVFGGGM